MDSVQSAKFISASKSRDLIKKLEGLVSKYDATHLHRQVLISGRVKSMNESIYYTVDQLHEAIRSNRQVRFQYFNWNVKKDPELRHDGAWYQVSPWSLLWDDEYYYLVGYDSADEKIKHYRVDKMVKLSVTEERREGREAFQDFNTAKYSKSIFGMFGGAVQASFMVGAATLGISGIPLSAATNNIAVYFVGLLTAYAAGFIATWLIGFDDPIEE